MTRRSWFGLGALCVFVGWGAFALLFCPGKAQICFKDQCVDVVVASTQQEMRQGLGGRASLAPLAGMFFVFPDDARHSFWMKGMLFDLDLIWIDKNDRVVALGERLPPCRPEPETCSIYTPAVESRYVLEVNAGYVKAQGIKEGDALRRAGF